MKVCELWVKNGVFVFQILRGVERLLEKNLWAESVWVAVVVECVKSEGRSEFVRS